MNPLDLIGQSFEMVDQILIQILTLKGPRLMLVFLLMLGYMTKLLPWISNDKIPLIVMIAGPLLAPFFIAWPKPGDMDPNIRYPEVAAYLQVCVMGFLVSAVAWLAHAKVLKPFVDDKLKADKPT